MQLKTFQKRVLGELRAYLDPLARARDDRRRLLEHDDPAVADLAKDTHFPAKAWPKSLGAYSLAVTGDGEPVPDVTVKVPTGGGKTLLACHAIAEIQRLYIESTKGLVVWIVPSHQIYRQTHHALRDREHPYRVALENALAVPPTGINVTEREKPLTPGDLEGCLTIMLLMLPAANRKSKDLLRMYRDSGRYAAFFPPDADLQTHRALSRQITNLDLLAPGSRDHQVQTSLANLLRINRPVIVVDEGHKAYSGNARATILGFNPSFILQLSATPKEGANVLVEATGRELDREEMIKIPIHVTPAPEEADWRTTMLRAKRERDRLEREADDFRQNSGRHIRPICLVQVERTGQDQLLSGHIHAQHVREYLVNDCNVPEDQVAIKSSDRDDIEKVDLLSEDCPVRFVITKKALQEGWDCAFAYVLVVLTNPASRESLTQLVGRVLRQPGARRTGVPDLDKCRVFSYRTQSVALLRKISDELEKEGLGDLKGRIFSDSATRAAPKMVRPKLRGRLKDYEGRLYLPVFSVLRGDTWEPIDFENDILAHVAWDQILGQGSEMGKQINVKNPRKPSDYLKYLPGDDAKKVAGSHQDIGGVDPVLMTRELTAHTANAWRTWDLVLDIIASLRDRHSESVLEENYVHILETVRRLVEVELDRHCESVFRSRLKKGEITFRLLEHQAGNAISKVRPVPEPNRLYIDDVAPKKSLFSPYDRYDFNSLETSVAICLDRQAKLLWWHRMATGAGYRIQGWRRHRIHPDFLASRKPTKEEAQTSIFVIETKGLHLVNDDTEYKQAIFDLCNTHTPVAKTWHDLGLGFDEHVFSFKVVIENEWENVLNGLFE